MKKKMRLLCRFLLVFGCLSASQLSGQNAFDDLFKGFDFDAFLNDMEKAFEADADRKAFGLPPKTPVAAGPEKVVTTTTPTTGKPQTRDELFLSPITQTIQEKGKPAKTVLTPASRNAFKEVMHEFISLLSSVQNKVEGSAAFSLPFKEQFAQFHETIDKIAIAYGTMVSKKLYATIMPAKQTPETKTPATKSPGLSRAPVKPAQPQQAANLRQNILDAIKDLKKLDEELSTVVAQEEKEREHEEAKLKELSRRPRTKITFDEAPIAASSRRKRGWSASQPKAKQPAKHKKVQPVH